MKRRNFIFHVGVHRVLLGACVTLAMTGCIVSNELKSKRVELQQLAAKTPEYPDFRQTDYSDILKGNRAIVTYFYTSSASFEDVKRFYVQTLSAEGWGSPQEEQLAKWFEAEGSRRLIFRKGEYTIVINYDAGRQGPWRFAVDYEWQAK